MMLFNPLIPGCGDEESSPRPGRNYNAREQSSAPVHTNRLAGEISPYLLQHAHNPVDWYPWCDEALQRARAENKPIFLSIGYSACHWCYVMERESFENPEVAAILNAHFIPIKVDREERPDLDEIYMTAVRIMTGSGGWPLNVFLTPDLQPFFGGTYFPPEDRRERIGFRKLLEQIADLWESDEKSLAGRAEELTRLIRADTKTEPVSEGIVDSTLLLAATRSLERRFDTRWGGFGKAPKFPPSGAIALLLRQYLHTGEENLLEMATTTLDRMAWGGMHDQIGGGFHRYSTDVRWLVPHFEKMLYDNALLARVYLEAFQLTGKPLYRDTAVDIFGFVLREMTDPNGGFHSSLDSDSEDEEGIFYVWSPDEIRETLGKENSSLFLEYYGITEKGNFEGRNIPHVTADPEKFSSRQGISRGELREYLNRSGSLLLAKRNMRVRPGKDDKILAAWNGMMISALARGYQVLGGEHLLTAAKNAARFILSDMVRDGHLRRISRSSSPDSAEHIGGTPGYLDDYAEMANGLIDLYEASFHREWLTEADRLTRTMIRDFRDERDGTFYYTSTDHKDLLTRTKPLFDGAVPSGNATAARVLFRLAALLDRPEYRKTGEKIRKQPGVFTDLLCAAEWHLYPVRELAVVGNPAGEETRALLDVIHNLFLPNRILALADPANSSSRGSTGLIPLLAGKEMVTGKATVYLCENYTCSSPVTDASVLETRLLGERGRSPEQ